MNANNLYSPDDESTAGEVSDDSLTQEEQDQMTHQNGDGSSLDDWSNFYL